MTLLVALPTLGRRALIGALLALQPSPLPAEEAIDVKAGWATLTATFEEAEQLVADVAVKELRILLRSPIVSDYLGFQPGMKGTQQPAAPLITAFPAESRARASAELRELLVDLEFIDAYCIERSRGISLSQNVIDSDEVARRLNDARQRLRLVIALYYGPDCVACNGEAKSVSQR